MSFKFKPGDLVEITKSKYGNAGHRFVVNNFGVSNLACGADVTLITNVNSYESDIKSDGGNSKFRWAPEQNLKLVNPDIDKISEFKFTELMDEITEAITVAK